MDAEDLIDKAVWDILVKIKKQEILNRLSSTITFGYTTKEEEQILLWLQDEKTIKLLNLSRYPRTKPPGVMPEEIKLEPIQPEFDEVYQEYNDYFNPPNPQKVKVKEAKIEIKEIIFTKKLKGKEKLFLQTLSTMKPVSLKELSLIIGTKHCKALKSAVHEKIRNTGWNIKTIKSSELGKDSFYQLEFLTK